jgi:hypothetical protein
MEARYKNIIAVLTISTGFVVLYMINGHRYFLTAAVIISIAALLSPYIAAKINQGWTWIGKMLGHVTNTVILSTLYFLLLVPIALISNRKRKKAFFLKNAPQGSSFTERGHTYTGKDMENIW